VRFSHVYPFGFRSVTNMASASAPGKVLICGGYLIVEPGNEGLSIGVSARFTTKVTAHRPSEGKCLKFVVESPQFSATFGFNVSVDSEGERVSIEQTDGRESPFIFFGLAFSVSSLLLRPESRERLLQELREGGFASLVLLAANDFYSQRNYLATLGKAVTAANLRTVPAHTPLVGEVSKTGLGSSASLTSSLVACLHAEYGVEDVELIHRVSQVAHSVAQGKIGSGFDVFTAIYGTSIYKRFDPTLISTLMSRSDCNKGHLSVGALKECVQAETGWAEHRPFRGLPLGVHLLLADIHQGGSGTPGMVAKIMDWKKKVEKETDNFWAQQRNANRTYLADLEQLSLLSRQSETQTSYRKVLRILSQHPVSQWGIALGGKEEELKHSSEELSILQLFVKVAAGAGNTRRLLAQIGEASQVEVEPPVLTPLLDATLALNGILAAGCPGAGGYDAVFALVLEEENCTAVEGFWETYPSLHVCPLLVREDPNGVVMEKHTASAGSEGQ
jgi:phosphomevalonate kinase